ncbi:DUF2170 family protein [Brumicola pallidula]|jgi:uncharacterized protein YjfI (DUF2170 family)|uniref:Cytoplasmic protein n=1 Tax=Brumicola pallidula DSM 14239 = ACAM 615 TaxID=1121922 RepID=K6Y503_9ALTE|nr:DUF2170 family protein [Glaciecola pallidula]GAC27849.1 hypothetical protein GPAL_0970 [Glaciecola pallidula DSM 14239 = ACAM 615]
MTWKLSQLAEIISAQEGYVVTHEADCLLIANEDGIDAWLAISGEQILVESLLFSLDEVRDSSALNEEILRTHMIFPLTTIGISSVAGNQYYTAFGSLSGQSKEESVLIEISTLFQNVEAFLDAYQDFLKSN